MSKSALTLDNLRRLHGSNVGADHQYHHEDLAVGHDEFVAARARPQQQQLQSSFIEAHGNKKQVHLPQQQQQQQQQQQPVQLKLFPERRVAQTSNPTGAQVTVAQASATQVNRQQQQQQQQSRLQESRIVQTSSKPLGAQTKDSSTPAPSAPNTVLQQSERALYRQQPSSSPNLGHALPKGAVEQRVEKDPHQSINDWLKSQPQPLSQQAQVQGQSSATGVASKATVKAPTAVGKSGGGQSLPVQQSSKINRMFDNTRFQDEPQYWQGPPDDAATGLTKGVGVAAITNKTGAFAIQNQQPQHQQQIEGAWAQSNYIRTTMAQGVTAAVPSRPNGVVASVNNQKGVDGTQRQPVTGINDRGTVAQSTVPQAYTTAVKTIGPARTDFAMPGSQPAARQNDTRFIPQSLALQAPRPLQQQQQQQQATVNVPQRPSGQVAKSTVPPTSNQVSVVDSVTKAQPQALNGHARQAWTDDAHIDYYPPYAADSHEPLNPSASAANARSKNEVWRPNLNPTTERHNNYSDTTIDKGRLNRAQPFPQDYRERQSHSPPPALKRSRSEPQVATRLQNRLSFANNNQETLPMNGNHQHVSSNERDRYEVQQQRSQVDQNRQQVPRRHDQSPQQPGNILNNRSARSLDSKRSQAAVNATSNERGRAQVKQTVAVTSVPARTAPSSSGINPMQAVYSPAPRRSRIPAGKTDWFSKSGEFSSTNRLLTESGDLDQSRVVSLQKEFVELATSLGAGTSAGKSVQKSSNPATTAAASLVDKEAMQHIVASYNELVGVLKSLNMGTDDLSDPTQLLTSHEKFSFVPKDIGVVGPRGAAPSTVVAPPSIAPSVTAIKTAATDTGYSSNNSNNNKAPFSTSAKRPVIRPTSVKRGPRQTKSWNPDGSTRWQKRQTESQSDPMYSTLHAWEQEPSVEACGVDWLSSQPTASTDGDGLGTKLNVTFSDDPASRLAREEQQRLADIKAQEQVLSRITEILDKLRKEADDRGLKDKFMKRAAALEAAKAKAAALAEKNKYKNVKSRYAQTKSDAQHFVPRGVRSYSQHQSGASVTTPERRSATSSTRRYLETLQSRYNFDLGGDEDYDDVRESQYGHVPRAQDDYYLHDYHDPRDQPASFDYHDPNYDYAHGEASQWQQARMY